MLRVRDLTVSFPSATGSLEAVRGISFDVRQGETFAIIGESGSGKSLTAMSIVGLTPDAASVSGSIELDGKQLFGLSDTDLSKVRGQLIGVVYQDPISALNPVQRIGGQIAEALEVHGLANRKTAWLKAVDLMGKMHIPDPKRVARAYPHQISGGMRQRAVFAMALACDPRLLIADEPTTALDVTIKAQVLELMKELQRELLLTTLLITHDMGVVAEIADTILVMYAGKIAEIGPASQILSEPRHPYTEALLQSAQIAETPPQSLLPSVTGAPPTLAERMSGCPFHPRCSHASARCELVAPELQTRDERASACHYPIQSKKVATL